MSLLKRLSEQAQMAKDVAAEQQRAQSERKDRYTAMVLPTVRALARYLSELFDHLKMLRPNMRQEYDLPGYGRFSTSPVFDYSVKTDVGYTDVMVQCTWKSRIDTERAPRMSLNSYERIRTLAETFRRLHFGGIKEERRGPTGLTIQASVQATGYVHSKLHVRGAVNDEQLVFTFENVDRLDTTRRAITIDLMSSEVFDRIGEFLMRENDTFIREQYIKNLKAPDDLSWLDAFKEVERATLNQQAAQAAIGKVDVVEGFVSATKQSEVRDQSLLQELSAAAALAEAQVKMGMQNQDLRGLSNEIELHKLDFSQVHTESGAEQITARPAIAAPPPAASAPIPVQASTVQAAPAPTPAVQPPAPVVRPPAPVVPAPVQAASVAPVSLGSQPAPPVVQAPIAVARAPVAQAPAPIAPAPIVQAPDLQAPVPQAVPVVPVPAPVTQTPVAQAPAAVAQVSVPPQALGATQSTTPGSPATPRAGAMPPAAAPAKLEPAKDAAAAKKFLERFKRMRDDIEGDG
jgi:hypothetical protein